MNFPKLLARELTMSMKPRWMMLPLLGALSVPTLARAEPTPHAYALVVGSNHGGAGQTTLSHAVDDADRVAALLSELGRTPREHITQLEDPSAQEVKDALESLRTRLTRHAAAGEQAQLLFYYSGHARASALSLGKDELSLESLRASLLALPSALTVVVLDACQSGAFSGVKGAAPAADFSAQSVQDLQRGGIAVMASSTGSELSQESSALGSSYFTHHLLVSLRGAGDRDRDGRVSLDEAYAYAYQHTLSDTARTQVGSQHATLETALTGRGDVPLSYPVDADAQLALSGAIEGQVLVQRSGRGAVVAELVKSAGPPLLLALPSGSYEVLVRGTNEARSCDVELNRGAVASLELTTCKRVELPVEPAKLASARAEAEHLAMESWFLELGVAGIFGRQDAYTLRLRDFGYQNVDGAAWFDAGAGYMFNRYLGVSARYGMIDSQELSQMGRNYIGGEMWWRTRALTFGVRARYPLLERWVVAFSDVGIGLGFTHGQQTYKELLGGTSYRVHHDTLDRSAIALRATVGLDFGLFRHAGLYLGGSFAWSPTLETEYGDKSGGRFMIVSGLRVHGITGGW